MMYKEYEEEHSYCRWASRKFERNHHQKNAVVTQKTTF